MKLALHIIAKDEYSELTRILDKYESYFDEVVIAYDADDFEKVKENLEDEKVKVFKYEWCDDFAHKRNFLADKTESEYYFRLDTDDDIIYPERIRAVLEKGIQNHVDVILFPYLYSHDEDGNCNAKHWRETIIRKDPSFYWKKTIHENIFSEGEIRNVNDDTVLIKHNITPEHIEESGRRNFRILLKEFNEDKEKTDPRTIAYLGRMLLSFGEYQKAIYFLEMLIKESGWRDDKYFAWIDMAHCYINLDRIDTAIACCNEAMNLTTEFPDAYNVKGECYIAKEDYKKAIDWLKIGLSKPEPKTQYVVDPSTYRVRAPMNMVIALFGTGEFELAHKLYQKVYAIAPNTEFVKNQKELIESSHELNEYIKALSKVYAYTKRVQPKNVIDLVKSIPDPMLKDERICYLRNKELPPKKWDDNSIVIYCCTFHELWSPASTITGIGGSEEATIYIANELTKLGYKVTVYNNCGEMAGIYNGVEYISHYQFNPYDHYNVLIGWRANIFNGVKARRKLMWLHDVPQAYQFESMDFDKVIVLSEYHKSLLPPKVPEEKVFVSSNGINLKDFKDYKVDRTPHRMMYSSSYDRGIEHLLEVWPEVRKEIPDAELHMFYGWGTYDKIVSEDSPNKYKFKEYLSNLIKQDGVFEHGRVGHKELNKEFAKSKFWVYPCHFPEISCISAMKAQAMGCVPISTNFAALKETVKDGVIVDGKCDTVEMRNKFKDAVIKALKEQPNVNIDKEQFGWDKVAKEWHDNILG